MSLKVIKDRGWKIVQRVPIGKHVYKESRDINVLLDYIRLAEDADRLQLDLFGVFNGKEGRT